MATLSSILKQASTMDYIKLAILVFGMGAAWARMESKFDDGVMELKSVIEQHIVKDVEEKKFIQSQLYEFAEVKKQVRDNTEAVILMSAFLRPESPSIRRRQR